MPPSNAGCNIFMPITILFDAFIDETQTMVCTTSDLGVTDEQWEYMATQEREDVLRDYMKTERMPHAWDVKLFNS